MYDLAPRFPEQDNIKKCFEPEIFAVDDPNGTCACKGPCYPFTSSLNRFNKKALAESPSPAHYYPKYRKYRITGGKSMQYTSPRICIVPDKGPSPLSYDPFSDYIPTIPRKIFRRKEVSHFYRAKCSGFSSFEDDIEIKEKIKPVIGPSTPLPDYLKFPGETSKTTIKYKGARWANYKSERKGLEIVSDVPGPGAYDIEPKIITKKPRPLVEKKESKIKKCIPPPPETPGLIEFGSEENIQPFRYCGGAQANPCKDVEKMKKCNTIWGCGERFTFKTNENPPPWAYSPIFATCHRKIVKLVPFASCKARFTYPKQTDISPASHNPLNGTVKEKACRGLAKYSGTLTAPFGSTAPRLKPIPTSLDFEESDSDTEEKQSYLAVVQVLAPQDKSDNQEEAKTDIVYNSECDYDHEIGPTLNIYDEPPKRESLEDIREVYKRYKSRRDHRKPLTREGFLSTTEYRSSWLVAKSAAHDVNWPKINDMKVTGGALKMNLPSHKKEMQPKEDLSVYYDIHPCYGSSVYKPTHNYRLKKEDICCKPIEDEDNVRFILKCFMPKEILNA